MKIDRGGESHEKKLETFTFVPGKLYLRKQVVRIGDKQVVRESLQFEIPSQKWNMTVIAELTDGKISRFKTDLVDNVFIEANRQQKTIESNKQIEHSLATDEDLARFITAKNSKESIQKWFEEVKKIEGLDSQEKERLEKIIKS